jgi:hypothetical protein
MRRGFRTEEAELHHGIHSSSCPVWLSRHSLLSMFAHTTHTRRESKKEAKGDLKIPMGVSKTSWMVSQGSKKVNLDVRIISHPGHKCIELAAYNAVIGVEAPRIYMSSVLLDAKVNSNRVEFEEKLREAQQEIFLHQRTPCNDADLRNQVCNELVVSYIMRRLVVVTKDIDLTKELRVELSTVRSMVHEKNQYVICKMPRNLHPAKFAFTKIDR